MRALTDLLHAARQLGRRQHRGFAAAAVATLALALASVMVIATLAYAVMLAPLPYADAERVIYVAERNDALGQPDYAVSTPNYQSWRERARAFEELAALRQGDANLGAEPGLAAERLSSLSVTSNLWRTLGQSLVAGRAFADDEEDLAQSTVVVIGERLWRRRFGGASDTVGRSLRIDGRPHLIIGIAPQDQGFTSDVDVWLPMIRDETTDRRDDRRLTVIGRLTPGASVDAARAEMLAITADLGREFTESNSGWSALVLPAREWIVGADVGARLRLLACAVILVLLMACANIASLQIARAVSRAREYAVRRALGAGRARLAREALSENLVLSLIAGVLAAIVARVVLEGLVAALPASTPRLSAIAFDGRVALIAIALGTVAMLVFGLMPALFAGRAGSEASMLGARGESGGARARGRQALVALQFALATVLLAGAAVLIDQFVRLARTPLGFEPARLLSARLNLPEVVDEASHRENLALYQRLLDQTRALPGVTAVGITSEVPMGAVNTSMEIVAGPVTNLGTEGMTQASWRIVSAGYLATLGVPLQQGQDFDPLRADANAIVLSAGLAARLWPEGGDVIGRQVTLGNGRSFRVIGVAGDVRQLGVARELTPTMYLPTAWYLWPTMTLVARTQGDPEALIAPLRQIGAQLSPERPIFGFQTLRAMVDADLAQTRLQAWVVAGFAIASLLLAALGIAGVIAYVVARRTSEMALRLALGARPQRLVRGTVGEGARLCAIGMALGIVVALPARGLLMHGVVGGVTLSLPALVLALGALLAVALFACWWPARRIVRIAPSQAMRVE